MALTTEQQAQVDVQLAIELGRLSAIETKEKIQRKQEMVRIAKEIIQENRRLSLVGEVSDITVSDISALANDLLAYVEG
jgi:hypothetical protein